MYSEILLNELYLKMIEYFSGDAKRVQHFVKVHSFAYLLGVCEGIDKDTLFILEAAAFVHDIGIKVAEKLCGSSDGKLQEKYGPSEAEKVLESCGFERGDIERITYLVAHHHTYANIDGADYQILVEADFLVNFYEDACDKCAITSALNNIFKTHTGKRICKTMFNIA